MITRDAAGVKRRRDGAARLGSRAPVAQGIERSPAEAEATGSNPVGRILNVPGGSRSRADRGCFVLRFVLGHLRRQPPRRPCPANWHSTFGPVDDKVQVARRGQQPTSGGTLPPPIGVKALSAPPYLSALQDPCLRPGGTTQLPPASSISRDRSGLSDGEREDAEARPSRVCRHRALACRSRGGCRLSVSSAGHRREQGPEQAGGITAEHARRLFESSCLAEIAGRPLIRPPRYTHSRRAEVYAMTVAPSSSWTPNPGVNAPAPSCGRCCGSAGPGPAGTSGRSGAAPTASGKASGRTPGR